MILFNPILRLLGTVWALAICPVSALLLLSCTTFHGAMFAIAALSLGVAPGIAWMAPKRPWVRRCSFIALGIWVLITLWLAATSPDGRPREGARVQNRYTGGGWHYPRWALGRLLPEVDQFMLGFKLVPVVDPLFTMKQSRSLSAVTRSIYSELEADADFHALGSVMPHAYDEIWGRQFDHGHCFLYVPPRLDRKTPAPALVFLHGSGGNFKAYTWLLSRVADDCGMVLIAPSNGLGNWREPQGSRAVAAALADAAKVQPLDMSDVHLAGLSNGGLGVSRVAASDLGERFRSLIFLSPVCDEAAIESPVFAAQWRGKRVLVITGDADDRIPHQYVTGFAALMRKSGAAVDMTTYANADHFLFFSHRERCQKQLSAWLRLPWAMRNRTGDTAGEATSVMDAVLFDCHPVGRSPVEIKNTFGPPNRESETAMDYFFDKGIDGSAFTFRLVDGKVVGVTRVDAN